MVTSGYSNQPFLFSLLLWVQRWALQHLPRGLVATLDTQSPFHTLPLILVYSDSFRRGTTTCLWHYLHLQEFLQQPNTTKQLRCKKTRPVPHRWKRQCPIKANVFCNKSTGLASRVSAREISVIRVTELRGAQSMASSSAIELIYSSSKSRSSLLIKDHFYCETCCSAI